MGPVSFHVADTGLRHAPALLGAFVEINVRRYSVTAPRRGVFFPSIDASRLDVVAVWQDRLRPRWAPVSYQQQAARCHLRVNPAPAKRQGGEHCRDPGERSVEPNPPPLTPPDPGWDAELAEAWPEIEQLANSLLNREQEIELKLLDRTDSPVPGMKRTIRPNPTS